jgi:flagellar basal-body rod protein FlgG
MNGAFYIGATGLRAQERALGVSANNIANMNTPGFKRSHVRFGELMAPARTADGLSTVRFSGASGVAALETQPVFDPGELRATGNVMDLAVQGGGFIEVLGPEGQTLLWRGGTLSVNGDGLLATADGLPLHALITMPEGASDLRISRDGVVTAVLAGDAAATELGRIDLISAGDPEALEVLGSGLYRLRDGHAPTTVVPGEEGAGLIVQGSIEASNVALSEEMVSLMLMQRAYAASAQALQVGDQLMGIANGLRR